MVKSFIFTALKVFVCMTVREIIEILTLSPSIMI